MKKQVKTTEAAPEENEPGLTAEQFAIWLKGFMDACGGKPTAVQLAKIDKKLKAIVASPQLPQITWIYQTIPYYVPLVQPAYAPYVTPSMPINPNPLYPPYDITCDTRSHNSIALDAINVSGNYLLSDSTSSALS
jgi:hypothetical protein